MFIQLRVTPAFCTDPSLATPFHIKHHVVNYLGKENFETFAGCTERLNKFGEHTHLHYHFNITGDFPDLRKDSFQAWFRRRPFGPKGNKSYSFKMVGDPEDENRWHRYLLKEGFSGLQEHDDIPLFPDDFDYELNRELAQDERKIQIQRNLDARERMLNNTSFKTVMFQEILHELQKENNGTTFKFFDIWFLLQGYFRAKGKVVPYDSMSNYTYDFMITYGIITPAQYFQQKYNDSAERHVEGTLPNAE